MNNFIKDLGKIFNIENLKLEQNTCAIQFENGIQIDMYFKEEDQSLRIASLLGTLISSTKFLLFKKILLENSSNENLDGNFFALSLSGSDVVLCTTVTDTTQTLEGASDSIIKLCEQKLFWHERLIADGLLVG